MNMNVRGKFKDEFNDLQRRLEMLRRDLETLDAIPASPGQGTLTRMARIEGTPQAGERVFQIIFVDAAYDPTDLTSAPTTTDRQVTPRHTCLNLTGETLTQGDLVIVFKLNGQWYAFVKAIQQDTSTGIVRIDESPGVGDCESASRSAECTWSAFIQNVDGTGATVCSPFSDNYAVWLIDVGHCSPVTTLSKNERYVAVKVAPQYDPDPGGAGTDPRELWAIRSVLSTPTTAVVRVDADPGNDCVPWDRSGVCTWSARIVTYDASGSTMCVTPSDGAQIWLIDVGKCNPILKLRNNDRWIAIKIADEFDPGSDPRPLYAIREPFIGTLDSIGHANSQGDTISSTLIGTPDFLSFTAATAWENNTAKFRWLTGPVIELGIDTAAICNYAFTLTGANPANPSRVVVKLYRSTDNVTWSSYSRDNGVEVWSNNDNKVGGAKVGAAIGPDPSISYYRLGAYLPSGATQNAVVQDVSLQMFETTPMSFEG